MPQSVASAYIDVIPRYSDQVCFTGGEPMLYYHEIVPLIRQAKALGLAVSMVTGAGWVSMAKPEIARERIAGLREAGLDQLIVSWDTYHEEWCTPDHALLVIEAARANGLPVHARGVMSAHGATPRIEQKLISIDIPYQKQDLTRLGKARLLPEDHFTFDAAPKSTGCNVIYLPVIEPDGNVYACCGPARGSRSASSPLILGNTNAESLDAIFHRAVRDPLLEALATVGPNALFQMVRNDPSLAGVLPIRPQYTGVCEMCLDMNEVPAVVERLRARIGEPRIHALLTAHRLYQQASPELRVRVPLM